MNKPTTISEWIYCPICNGKTRVKRKPDTVLLNFPLFCPKCKQEIIVNIVSNKMLIVSESDT